AGGGGGDTFCRKGREDSPPVGQGQALHYTEREGRRSFRRSGRRPGATEDAQDLVEVLGDDHLVVEEVPQPEVGFAVGQGEGRQAVILRKGGVSEAGGAFRVEHERFWLYPTYLHQQQGGTVEELAPLLEKVTAGRPPAGTVRIGHFAEVVKVLQARTLESAL